MDAKVDEEQSFLGRLAKSGKYDTEKLVIQNHEHLIQDVRSYLRANGYNMALACMDLAIEKNKGRIRGDKKTPSIIHEVSQALYTISLMEAGVQIEDPESVIALNFVHDLGEDHDLKPTELLKYLYQADLRDNERIMQLTRDFNLMTKKNKAGEPRYNNEWEYYEALKESQNASLAKLIDRLHNLATQIGVKSEQRCSEYIRNTQVILNDYVAYASKKFPEQTEAYSVCRQMIDTTCQISRYYLARHEIGKPLPDMDELAKEMPVRGFSVPIGLNPIFLSAKRVIKQFDMPKNERAEQRSMLSNWLKLHLGSFNFNI